MTYKQTEEDSGGRASVAQTGMLGLGREDKGRSCNRCEKELVVNESRGRGGVGV